MAASGGKAGTAREAAAGEAGTARENPSFTQTLLEAGEPPIEAAYQAAIGGAGVEGLLDSASLAVAKRLLRYDNDLDFDDEQFGWLQITHGLTYSRAARWAWHHDPGPHTARLALFAVWLAFDTGRAERHHGVAPEPGHSPEIERALGGDLDTVADELAKAAMDDRGGSFIVVAHLVKTVQAARADGRCSSPAV